MKRLPELAVLAAMIVFVIVGNRVAGELPSWHEIVSALPNNPTRVLADDGGRAWIEPSCLDTPQPRWIVSPSRPHLSLCAGSQQLPVVVTPYASGIVAWPLALFHRIHQSDTFSMRRLWVVVAALALVLTFRLVSRIADRTTASLACVAAAASSPFVLINALLLPFETLPCTLVVAALSCWSDVARAEGPRSSRLYAGALFAGFALAANLKAVFLFAPIVLLAHVEGVRWRGIRIERATTMLAIVMVPLMPIMLFAAADPQHGVSQQLAMRGATFAENLRLERFVREPLRLVNGAADFGSYFELAQGGDVRWRWPHFVVAPPLAWCAVVAVARAFGRRWGSRLSMGCGAILVTYFFVSTLLYRQIPGGNYAPLHEVFGVAIASAVVDVARLVSRRHPSRASAYAAVGVGVVVASSLVVVLRGVDFSRRVTFSINAAAERAAAADLSARADADRPIYSTTYNLAGVLDALGRGRLHTVQMHHVLARCERVTPVDPCLEDVWRRVLTPERLPLRVVVPSTIALVDKPVVVTQRVDSSLHVAAAALGLRIENDGIFSTIDGIPMLAIYRISAAE